MFNLNYNNGILDAATVGDPTRCLNDSIDEDALNVKAECECSSSSLTHRSTYRLRGSDHGRRRRADLLLRM